MVRVITQISLSALLAMAFVFNVSCSSKAKKEGQGESDGNIAAKDISFDACGSDCGNIAGLKTVQFDYDQATLTAEARKTLSDNATWIKGQSAVTIQVEGHCDKSGSAEYNLALGERRAKAVKSYLSSLGIDGKRLQIISYGKEKLLDNGDNDSAHAKNRRANFVPLPGN